MTPTSTVPSADRLIESLEPGQEVEIRSIHMQTPSEGWAVGKAIGEQSSPDHVLWTDDGGRTWRDVTPMHPWRHSDPRTAELGATFFLGPEAWVYFNGSNEVSYSSEPGAAWRGAAAGDPIAVESWLTFSDGSRGWLMQSVEAGMGTELVALYRTSDSGSHWTQILDPYESEYLQSCFKTGIDFVGVDIGWITLDCQGIYLEPILEVSSDGGESWEQRILPLPENAPRSPESGFCSSDAPALLTDHSGWLRVTCVMLEGEQLVESSYAYLTLDSGENWRIRDMPAGEPLFMSEAALQAMGRDQFVSTDAGERWTRLNTVIWDGQYSFVDLNNGWAVATSGDETALVFTNSGGRIWEIIEPVIAYE